MRIKHLTLTCILLVFVIGVAGAKMRPVKKLRAGVPPFQIIEEMIRCNDTVIAAKTKKVIKAKGDIVPHMTWLADCDARIQTTLFSKNPEAKIYTVRNLGNQLAPSIGAVDYGVIHLYSPVLLITGNTDSEALRLFNEGYAHLDPFLRKELDHLHLPLAGQKAAKKDKLSKKDKWLRLVERNVDFQVAEAVKRYQSRVASGRLVVIGAVVDLSNAYGNGAKRLVVINVNNQRDSEKIRKLPHMARLDKKLLRYVGREQAKKTSKAAKK